jgi:hypothetical protein
MTKPTELTFPCLGCGCRAGSLNGSHCVAEGNVCDDCHEGWLRFERGEHMLDCPEGQRDGFRAAAKEAGA